MATEEKQSESASDLRRATLTNEDKLALANIPLRAQVLNVPMKEFDNNEVDRRSSNNLLSVAN
jgi:hypothetical protein